jgi:hypothetical protein
MCAANGYCKNPNVPASVSVASALEGQACDDANEPHCLGPAYRLNKVCVLPNQRCQ